MYLTYCVHLVGKKVGVIKLYKTQALPYKENNRHSRKRPTGETCTGIQRVLTFKIIQIIQFTPGKGKYSNHCIDLGVPGGRVSHTSRKSSYEDGKVVSPKHWPPLPAEHIPGTHFC
jgi:hypothetical protein